MGACCGKPDRKSQGNVLGSGNPSSNTSAVAPGGPSAIAAGKAKTTQQSGAKTLGGSPSSPRQQGELSASALAAQKRAEAAENRGVQQGGGKLAKKLAKEKQQSPFVVEQPMPEPMNR
ncbi:hypothetical protein BGZ58_000917 [Dissophora ornata]|nr:hypothetical protein BGZ58_000917 [Dissophora ornata]